jgi:hypothetical protein
MRVQWGSQLSTGRDNVPAGRAFLLVLGQGLLFKRSDFEAENATLKGNYLRQVVENVVGGIQTVLEVHCMC